MQKGFSIVNLHGTASGVIATPYIGENGNWFIGNEDTGIIARGEKGEKGDSGPAGIYSTTATRIGTWIDGRPIYRRVIKYPEKITGSDSSLGRIEVVNIGEVELSNVSAIIEYTTK